MPAPPTLKNIPDEVYDRLKAAACSPPKALKNPSCALCHYESRRPVLVEVLPSFLVVGGSVPASTFRDGRAPKTA